MCILHTHVVNMNVSREKSRVKDQETKQNRQKPNVRESLSEKWIAILLKSQSRVEPGKPCNLYSIYTAKKSQYL
jgi:hypothetical protein